MQWLRITILLLCFAPTAFGDTSSSKVSQKEATQKLVTLAAAIQTHERELSTVEQELNQTRVEEGTILAELERYNQRLMETIHYLRHATQYSPLLAMLSASKPVDVIHSSMLLRSITPQIHQHNQQLLEKVKALSKIRNQLEAKQNQLRDITFKYHEERVTLDTLLKAPRQERTIEDATQNAPNELALMSPVVGKLIPTYASKDPQWSSYTQGVLFSTRSEAQVVAPLSGTIVFAGNYANGQGKMVSIQTPIYLIIMSGLHTLNRNCIVGQSISLGEPMGTMKKVIVKKAKATPEPAPRLYLEVWRHEETIDPQTVLQDIGKIS
jgi:septal ring factor EnvC (AmiA/AmiB activator)